MKSLKCIIIEDDFAYSLNIKIMVKEMGLKVACLISKFEDIIPKISECKADIILSDVKIGDTHLSYEALSQIQDLPPVIFFSGYADDELYLNSKSVSSYIYLIKPFSNLTLRSAIDGALHNKKKAISEGGDIHGNGDLIFVRVKGKLISIDPRNILYVESEGNYCFIYTTSQKIAIRSSLGKVIDKITSNDFCQIHRAYLINLKFVDKFSLGQSEAYIANTAIPIGRKYKRDLVEKLKQ